MPCLKSDIRERTGYGTSSLIHPGPPIMLAKTESVCTCVCACAYACACDILKCYIYNANKNRERVCRTCVCVFGATISQRPMAFTPLDSCLFPSRLLKRKFESGHSYLPLKTLVRYRRGYFIILPLFICARIICEVYSYLIDRTMVPRRP